MQLCTDIIAVLKHYIHFVMKFSCFPSILVLHLIISSTVTLFRYDFSATESELESLTADFGGLFKIPENFSATVSAFNPSSSAGGQSRIAPPQIKINPQTTLLCDMLGITDPFAVFSGRQPFNGSVHVDHQPVQGGFDEDDTNDSLDVDDRDEGILDDSDFIDTTFESSSSFAGVAAANFTFNPDEISLDDDEEGLRVAGDSCVEPPVKRLSLSPCCGDPDDCRSSPIAEASSQPAEPAADTVRGELNSEMQPDRICLDTPSALGGDESNVDRITAEAGGPVNRLKRRNIAIYTDKEQNSSDES